MEEYAKEVIIKDPLKSFMMHCEIYCTAACCEKQAFEVNQALLIRKMIDENLAGNNGQVLLHDAFRQFKGVKEIMLSPEISTYHNQIPIWYNRNQDLPSYWLETNDLQEWLDKWEEEFIKATSQWPHAK